MWSPASETLVWGTMAHEGAGFDAIKQYGNGPAVSWAGIEPNTYNDLLRNSLPGLARTRPAIVAAYSAMVPRKYSGYPPAEYLMRNLEFAVATCRLLYFRVRAPLPPNDLMLLAQYWKQYYNTIHGAGTVTKWLKDYQRYCA